MSNVGGDLNPAEGALEASSDWGWKAHRHLHLANPPAACTPQQVPLPNLLQENTLWDTWYRIIQPVSSLLTKYDLESFCLCIERQGRQLVCPVPAVVDLPTPPLPEATAIMLCTPSTAGLLPKGGPLPWLPTPLARPLAPCPCHKPWKHRRV